MRCTAYSRGYAKTPDLQAQNARLCAAVVQQQERDAAVVAGRFGHPARKRERTSTGATSSALPRRCAMSQILLSFMRFVIDFTLPNHRITEGVATKKHLWTPRVPA